MLIDYHVHTYLCKHAEGDPADYVIAARNAGLFEIGFADHCPFPEGYDPKYRMKASEIGIYRKIVKNLQTANQKIVIRYGIEADWVPGKMDKVFSYLQEEDFDYVLGSVHYIEDFPFDSPDIQHLWKEGEFTDKIWEKYFSLVTNMIKSGKFDILSHFDLPKKFGFRHSNRKQVLGMCEDIFKLAGQKGMALELNSSGLRKPVKEAYPALDILKIARENRVRLVFGSDAHKPEEVSANFGELKELANLAGYKHVCSFSKRKAMEHSI